MPLFRRKPNESKASTNSDGPEEWARIARERDAEIMRQRAAEAVGDKAVHLANGVENEDSGQHESRQGFSDVGELSEDYLRLLNRMGVRRGKFVRLGDTMFVSPGKIPGHQGGDLTHEEIIMRALRKPGIIERAVGSEALEAALKTAVVGEHGLADAGKFDIFFLQPGEEKEDGTEGRFRIFGASGSYGLADPEGRQESVEVASKALGPHIHAEYAKHLDFSL